MVRFFLEPEAIQHDPVIIGSEGKHYLVSVLRMRAGDELELFDGTGRCCKAQITEIKPQQITVVKITDIYTKQVEPKTKLTLGQALIRNDKMDWIVQKATELGVSRIIPVITSRSHRINKSQWPAKQSHWQKIAASAARQSGRTIIPAIEAPVSLAGFLDRHQALKKLILMENMPARLANWPDRLEDEKEVGLLIGPEGGFDAQEAAQAIGNGCQPVYLGPRVLRAETAAIAAMSILQYILDELG